MTSKEDGEFVTRKEFRRKYISKSKFFSQQLVQYGLNMVLPLVPKKMTY